MTAGRYDQRRQKVNQTKRAMMFDKSALQGLREDVHEAIAARYFVVTAPTMLMEIAGDLAEDREFGDKTPQEKVQMIARKFCGSIELHRQWEDLCRRSLVGMLVRHVDGPIIQRGVEGYRQGVLQEFLIVRDDGTTVSPQQNWLDRLVAGTWTLRYPSDTRGLAEEVRRLAGSIAPHVVRIKKTNDQAQCELAVVAEVERVLATAGLQLQLLEWIANTMPGHVIPPATLRKSVRRRWRAAGMPPLSILSPYAHYCARVLLLYLVGFEVWPKGRELHDIADLEYLCLLPFVDVFVAQDRLQRAVALHLLSRGQTLACSCQLEREIAGSTKREAECQRLHGGKYIVAGVSPSL